MPSYRGIGDHEPVGRFQLISNGFHYFEVNLFKKWRLIFWILPFLFVFVKFESSLLMDWSYLFAGEVQVGCNWSLLLLLFDFVVRLESIY